MPDVTQTPDSGCSNDTLDLIPQNVTSRTSFPPDDYPFIAFAPWTNAACVQSYMTLMRAEAVRAALFYHDKPGSSAEPPSVSDPSWSLDDGGAWKDQNQFPIYALSGATGAQIMRALGEYSGNMTSAPNGEALATVYDPRDTVRLFARMNVTGGAGIPSLWIFLIIVLAILLAIVLVTSVIMHIIQRRQRTLLARRVAAGEVDLEALGIKRLNVPQEILDKMPQYTYTSKEAGAVAVPGARQVPFTQPTCPICLDDFVHGETMVRELPCNHIFHPECIDPFLKDNSSLCPMCKKSSLPAGYCPVHVTNLMVRRERLIRRMRQRTNAENGIAPPLGRRATMMSAMGRRVRGLSTPSAVVLNSSTAAGRGDAYHTAQEMNIINATGGRGRVTNDANAPAADANAANAEGTPEVPAEVAAQGIHARRAWLRQRLARQQEQEYSEAAAEARNVDERRPRCEFMTFLGGRLLTLYRAKSRWSLQFQVGMILPTLVCTCFI